MPSPSVSTPPPSSGTQQPISQLYRYTTRTSLPPSLSLSDLTRPGGRQSVSGVVATVFGSSGFLGRYAVNHLGRIGSQVIVPYRGDGMSSRHLRLNGDLGQIVPVPFSLYDASSITKAVQQSNIVINCIGSRYETANYKYDDVNAKSAPSNSPPPLPPSSPCALLLPALPTSLLTVLAVLRVRSEYVDIIDSVGNGAWFSPTMLCSPR